MALDLEKVKQEIDNRKKERTHKKTVLGESSDALPAKGDDFLRQIKQSVETGIDTPATKKMRAVSKISEAKANKQNTAGMAEKLMQESKTQKSQPQYPPQKPAVESERERIKRLQEEADRQEAERINQSMTMADAMKSYNQQTQTPQINNNGMLNEEQMKLMMGLMEEKKKEQVQSQPNMLNEELIVEKVNQVTERIINENFGKLFSEALKNTIIETYKNERVREALMENKDVIEKMVVKTITDLRNRSKKTQK